MNVNITELQFLIEAIQEKADNLIRQLQEEAEQEIMRGFTQHVEEQFDEAYAEHIKTAPKPRGRPVAKKAVRRTRK
jgi:hypothetical protein